MGRGVAVAADDRHARLRNALFGTYDVHNAVVRTSQFEVFDSVFLAVFAERFELFAALFFGYGLVLILCRHVMVGCPRCLLRACYLDPSVFQAQKSNRRGHLVDVVPVDI